MNKSEFPYILIKMLFRKIIITALLIFSAHFAVFPQKYIEEKFLFGNNLSTAVDKAISKKGFSPVKQELSSTGQDKFAYNILLDFPPTKASENQDESENPGSQIRRTEVIFCFQQEDFQNHESEIFDFLTFLQGMERDWSATILFSALDNCEFKDLGSIRGTQVFASSVEDSDSCCALAISFNSYESTTIYTGGSKFSTPLWLTKRITDTFFDTQTNFSFKNQLASIYRLGLLKGTDRLSFFFDNNIPAIELSFPGSQEFSSLKRFAETYQSDGTGEWDMHYVYINRGNMFKAVFINERTIIISCLSVGILTILILCIFSFLGEHGERHKYDFIKSSYMIPFTIGIAFLSLLFGQHFVAFISAFFPLNPIFQYGIKIVFSMIFISILFVVQGLFKFSATAFIYGYLLMVVAIFNIFLFSTRDLTLFVIFVAEYIIIYISRIAKNLPALCVFFILMLIPFVPYGYIIIRSADDFDLTNAVFTSARDNLLLSLAIFPFQITWLRILVFLNIRAGIKGWTMKKMILNGIFSTIAILTFTFALIFAISHFVYRPDFRESQRIETKIFREEKFTISAKLSKDEFSGMTTNHIKLISEEDALRYKVVLNGNEGTHPIYDSIYDYTIITNHDGTDSYSFVIPEYPPKNITIDYAAPEKTPATIEVTAYYKTDDQHTFRIEKRELNVE